ncbi:MAG: hypothetical protein ACREGJ_04855 [Candidatus Saccharimonadales bacterium]
MTKFRIPKAVYLTIISVLVLLILFVGGGVAYTWFMGQNSKKTLGVETPVETTRTPVIKPTRLAPDAPVGASVTMLTSPVMPGENASITVKTNPEAKCTIKVEYNDVPSTDSGLKPKIADEYGIISWTWTVPGSAPLGKWPVEVKCANDKRSAVVVGDLVVKQ